MPWMRYRLDRQRWKVQDFKPFQSYVLHTQEKDNRALLRLCVVRSRLVLVNPFRELRF